MKPSTNNNKPFEFVMNQVQQSAEKLGKFSTKSST
jgi:hypothetical protein